MVIKVGDTVRIGDDDGDGAANSTGIVLAVYPSGRCMVKLPDGGIRNIHSESLEVIE